MNQLSDRGFTPRALVAGLLVGILINFSNTYYGLRVGSGSQMSMISALLGFIIFKLFSRHLGRSFSLQENVLVISTATATGCMTFTAGFINIIPALEYLIGPEENGPINIPTSSLLLWSIGLCFFGTIFAALLREQFIVREKLPWPGPKATAQLLHTLHHKSRPLPGGSDDFPSSDEATDGDGFRPAPEEQPLMAQTNDIRWETGMRRLIQGAMISGVVTIAMFFVPVFHDLPILGPHMANEWLWTMDLSPGFFGGGIITGTAIPLHMLFGSIVGWGILSPYAKHKGWAPGNTDDWETGSRGWIIWVSLAALLADASVKLLWFLIRPFWWSSPISTGDLHPTRAEAVSEDVEPTQNLLVEQDDRLPDWHPSARHIDQSAQREVRPRVLWLGFLVAVLICIFSGYITFRQYITWYYTLLAIALSLPMAAVGIRCLAETDYNPGSALVSQLVFATLIPHSNPNGIIMNLLAAAISQAGSNQSGELAYDLKIGSLTGSRPEVQTYGQIIGSIFGALIACSIYKLYASQYTIPGPLFRVPASFLVLSTARLLMGQGLPEGVAPFVIAAAILSAAVTIVKMRYETRWWQCFIPSGVSFAIGIYNLPSYTITRALGGLFYWFYKRRNGGRAGNIVILASGLVLGESVASIATVALSAARAS